MASPFLGSPSAFQLLSLEPWYLSLCLLFTMLHALLVFVMAAVLAGGIWGRQFNFWAVSRRLGFAISKLLPASALFPVPWHAGSILICQRMPPPTLHLHLPCFLSSLAARESIVNATCTCTGADESFVGPQREQLQRAPRGEKNRGNTGAGVGEPPCSLCPISTVDLA